MSETMYREFLKVLAVTPQTGQIMPYEWKNLPDPLGALWMPYSQMLDEFSRELANIVNDFTRYLHQLHAWAVVVTPMSDEENLEATHSFVDVLATTAVNLPYVIRSRFIFATAQLCHQANMTHEMAAWKDDLPLDSKIYMADADRSGASWRKYKQLKICIEAIGGQSFREATYDFRNAYNHRFSPRFVVGMTSLVTRRVSTRSDQVTYSFGGLPALNLSAVAALLSKERDRCYKAFHAFQGLVHEHEAAIAAFK